MFARIAGRKYTWTIALLCTLLVLFAATKIKAAEISRPDEELRIGQCDADATATVGHPFVLQNYNRASYLLPQGREVRKQLPTTFSPTYRGPPASF